jgi:hypothetical protein
MCRTQSPTIFERTDLDASAIKAGAVRLRIEID